MFKFFFLSDTFVVFLHLRVGMQEDPNYSSDKQTKFAYYNTYMLKKCDRGLYAVYEIR
jgi:hypothetical protein